MSLQRDQRGDWNLQEVFHGEDSNGRGLGAFLSGYDITVVNGRVTLVDAYERQEPQDIRLTDVELQLSKQADKDSLELVVSAKISGSEKGSRISLYGVIEEAAGLADFGTSPQSPAASKFDFYAQVELATPDLLKISKIIHLEEIPIDIHGRIKAQTHIRFAPGVKGYDLFFSDFVVVSEAVDLQGNVSVAGLLTQEPPTIFVNWSSAPVPLDVLPKLLPQTMVPSEFQEAVNSQRLGGAIQVVSATASGSSREPKNGSCPLH